MDPMCRILSEVDGPVLVFSLTYASAIMLYVELAVMSPVFVGLRFGVGAPAAVFNMPPLPLGRAAVLRPCPRMAVAVGSPTRGVLAKSRRIFVTAPSLER